MSEPTMPWADLLAWSDGRDPLAKRLYAVLSEPVSGLQPVLDNLEAHVAYLHRTTVSAVANKPSGCLAISLLLSV